MKSNIALSVAAAPELPSEFIAEHSLPDSGWGDEITADITSQSEASCLGKNTRP